MFQDVSTTHERPAPATRDQARVSVRPFLAEPLADLGTLAVPRYASRPREEAQAESREVHAPSHTSSLESAISRLNAKISFGHIGALSTLAAFTCAGASGLLQATSLLTLSTLALLSANTLRIRNYRHERALDELTSAPPSIYHLGSLARAQSIVRPLCQRSDIPEPLVIISPEPTSNAAMMDRLRGRDILILTEGILRTLNDRELSAVIAHEISHQNRWYTRLIDFTSTISAWTKPMATWGTLFLTLGAMAPTTGIIVATPIALATAVATSAAAAITMGLFGNYVSRHNEVKTDLRACAMTGDPEALISALRKLEPASPEYQEALRKRARLGLLTHPLFEQRARHIRRVFGTSN